MFTVEPTTSSYFSMVVLYTYFFQLLYRHQGRQITSWMLDLKLYSWITCLIKIGIRRRKTSFFKGFKGIFFIIKFNVDSEPNRTEYKPNKYNLLSSWIVVLYLYSEYRRCEKQINIP